MAISRPGRSIDGFINIRIQKLNFTLRVKHYPATTFCRWKRIDNLNLVRNFEMIMGRKHKNKTILWRKLMKNWIYSSSRKRVEIQESSAICMVCECVTSSIPIFEIKILKIKHFQTNRRRNFCYNIVLVYGLE